MPTPIALPARRTIELIPTAPFHFDATLHKPDHFPSADNAWEPGVRWQTMRWEGRSLGLRFESRGTVDEPAIALTIWSEEALSPGFLDRLVAEIEYRYNLRLDLTEFNRRFADDPQLGPIIARWRGMRDMNPCSLYEFLLIAIMLQNATVRRSVNMMQALLEHYGTLLAYDGRELYCFGDPAAIHRATELELRALKLGYRAKSIQRVTEAFVQGKVDEMALRGRPGDEQRAAMLSLYGVGPASVGYILTGVFHHLDELSHISPWEQKIYSRLFFGTELEEPMPADALLRLFDERFSGYRALAVHYVWEDLFWQWKHGQADWLGRLIRL